MNVKTITRDEFENGLCYTENHFIIGKYKWFYLNVDIQDYAVFPVTTGDVEELLECIELYTKQSYFIVDSNTNTDDIKIFWKDYEYLFTGDLKKDLYEAYDKCLKALNSKK